LPDHRLIVARWFRVAGLLIGVPSALAAIGLGLGAGVAGAGPATQKPEYLDVSTYGIVGLISNAASGAGQILSFLNGVAAWVFGLLAVLALIAALLAALLYLVGRGLRASASWARVVAIAALAVLSLNSLIALTFFRGVVGALDAAALALFVYALWVLVRRWRPQPA
jgi:hypothetical protein